MSLSSAITGRVLLPGDVAFEQATRPWNLAIEQRVSAVVEAASADDVAAAVKYAKANGLTVTAQPSGHGASGDTDGVILIRTSALTHLDVRPADRLAVAGAGVKWGQVLAEAGPHGLVGMAGSSPAVSVTGYTLGGGLSWFSRAHGFASDSVHAFQIVDADGERARVSADSDPELFWALKGGGGDFALVTEVEFDLHPAPELYGGRVVWHAERTEEVQAAFREITEQAPEKLTVWLDLLRFPGAPPMVAIDATYLGSAAEGAELLRPLDRITGAMSDGRGLVEIAKLGDITGEPVDPSAGNSHAELLTELDDRALLDIPVEPLLSVQVRHLGGALSWASDSAAGTLAEPYLLYLFGIPGEGVSERQAEFAQAQPTSGRKPYTFLKPGESATQAFAPKTIERLREIKRRRDPNSVFRANYPVL
ncbi:FAD-binding oxidoreductase [Nonomuraea sp. NBC_01738]|nr:FAD-binding oxidoreductase [Nonomuraea sp. NBC_01738]